MQRGLSSVWPWFLLVDSRKARAAIAVKLDDRRQERRSRPRAHARADTVSVLRHRSRLSAAEAQTLTPTYFAPPAGTFAFSSSNQFWMRLMCVTGGVDGDECICTA